MIYIKKGASIRGIRPEVAAVIPIVASVYKELFDADTIVTCGVDDTHKPGSLHYAGMALDFRTRHISVGQQEELKTTIEDCLGPEFDVVLHRSHLHIEFQPKLGLNL